MAYSHTTRLVLIALLVVVLGLMGSGPSPAQAQTCSGTSLATLNRVCGAYVRKTGAITSPPSGVCCAVARGANMACLCKQVTSAMESLVDPKKVVAVARYCKVFVKSGTKCGSYTVPAA